jgi:hypothetical protein
MECTQCWVPKVVQSFDIVPAEDVSAHLMVDMIELLLVEQPMLVVLHLMMDYILITSKQVEKGANRDEVKLPKYTKA